jgi:hypothetical protein
MEECSQCETIRRALWAQSAGAIMIQQARRIDGRIRLTVKKPQPRPGKMGLATTGSAPLQAISDREMHSGEWVVSGLMRLPQYRNFREVRGIAGKVWKGREKL